MTNPSHTIQPTAEQIAVIDYIQQVLTGSVPSLVVEALAGSAKTTTMKLALQQAQASGIDLTSVLAVAFNKRIADDLTKALSAAVTCKTLNAIGHGAWSKTIGSRLTLDANKLWEISSNIKLTPAQIKSGLDIIEVARAVRIAITVARNTGFVPAELKHPAGRSLVSHDTFLNDCEKALLEDSNDTPLDDWWMHFIPAIRESIRQAYEGLIDFADQLYMSTCFGGVFPQFKTVFVDEAQDLSPLNHKMLSKLVARPSSTVPNGGRLVAIGDSRQAIYGFRGASSDSLRELSTQFDANILKLTTCFRCPKEVVKEAQRIVPTIQSPDWMKDGQVLHTNRIPAFESFPFERLAILCRNNAPLLKMAFHLIKHGRGVQILGHELGQGLIRQVKKLCPERCADMAEFQAQLKHWYAAQTPQKQVQLADRMACLEVCTENLSSPKDIIPHLESLFGNKEALITLSTGHKCKGFEWPHVWIIHPDLVPSGYAKDPAQIQQEWNLLYVMITRAQKVLTIINTSWPVIKHDSWDNHQEGAIK